MPDIPQATGTSKFVSAWNAVVALALDWKKLRVVAPLKLTRVPGAGAVISYEGTGGSAAVVIYASTTDTASGVYQGGFCTAPVGPISTTTNLTSGGGGNDLFVDPTGAPATALRLYAGDELNLSGSVHNLVTPRRYGCIPWTAAFDGTNTYPGYLIVCDLGIDAACATG